MAPEIISNHNLPRCTSEADLRKHPIPLAWHLMLDAGLRVGELQNLAWCDLIHDHVPKTQLVLAPEMTKNAKARTVPITKRLHDAIVSALSQRPLTEEWRLPHYALAARPGRPCVSVRTIERAIKRIGHRACGIDITPHTLRHTFATRLLFVSNTRVVQAALGHSRVATTEVYTHVNGDDLTEAVARLDPTT